MQVGQILEKTDEILIKEKPDRLLILGDTNSGLASIAAARRNIPVYHLEAGNRCYDNRVPEEINRRIIDHTSDILLPYTKRSAENLVSEGIKRERIFVVGNPIGEVLAHFEPNIKSSMIMSKLNLEKHKYFLATMHRAENVDEPERLNKLFFGFKMLAEKFKKPIVLSVHPRTGDRIKSRGLTVDQKNIILEKPFGLFDFINLEKNAYAVITDSGTVQEEACIFNIPNVTIRDVTERPETTECGSNILTGADSEIMINAMKLALKNPNAWIPPEEYQRRNVSTTVAKIVLSYRGE